LVGVAHPHVWGILRLLKESDLGSLAAASVEPTQRTARERLQKEYKIQKIYGDYRDMLDEEDIDVVFNYSDHILRTDVTTLAASKGLHIMLEKPMAYNLPDAERMLAAAEEKKVTLMVNWPTMWSSAYRKAHELVGKGAIGDVYHIRTRTGHNSVEERDYAGSCFEWMGQKGASGAYMDFCCYGVALAVWLMGMPKKIFGVAGNYVKSFMPSYDNGIVVMVYDRGTATVEGTWSQIGSLSEAPKIFGSKGTISIGDEEVKVFTKDKPEGRSAEMDPLPEGEANAVEYLLTRVKYDEPITGMCDPKLSRDCQEILEAGLIASEVGKAITLPLRDDRG